MHRCLVSRASRPAFGVALLAAAALIVPAGASAKTIASAGSGVITLTGDDAPSRIVASGGNGEGKFQDDLPGGVIEAAAGCTQTAPNAVDCGKADAGMKLTANLGGGDDYYRVPVDAIQEIDAGSGNDTVETGNAKDILRGGPGDDVLLGGAGDDVLDGGDGDDRLEGWDGSDEVTGGPGRDKLFGDGGPSPGANRNDKLFARDGEADIVDCGGGSDVAELDAKDSFVGCSNVDQPGRKPGSTATSGGPTDGSAGSGGTGSTGTGGTTKPKPTFQFPMAVLATVTQTRTPADLAKGRKVGLRLTTSVTCKATLTVKVKKGEAKRLRLGKKARAIGVSQTVNLVPGLPTIVNVGVDAKKDRKRLKRAKKLRTTVAVSCTSEDAAAFSGELKLTLRR